MEPLSSMSGLPIGAGVRYAGALAIVVAPPSPAYRIRGFVCLRFDGLAGIKMVRARNVALVAKRYEAAKRWEEKAKWPA